MANCLSTKNRQQTNFEGVTDRTGLKNKYGNLEVCKLLILVQTLQSLNGGLERGIQLRVKEKLK